MKGLRIGICALVTFTVLAHGAVEPWSEAVLEIGAGLLLVVWALLLALGSVSKVRWNWLLGPVIGLLVFAGIQYVTNVTAVPFLTYVEILKLGALAILLFLAVQAYETLEHWQGFAWFLLALGFVVSAFGVIQYFTFNGKLYWFREMRFGGVPFGPYVNRNHFAGLIELIVPLGLSILLLRAEDRDRLPLVAVLTLLPVGALSLAASRGGIVSVLVEVALILVLVFLRQGGRKQLIPVAIILVLAGALVGWLGIGQALDRFGSYRKLEVGEARRAEMARDSWRIFQAHPIGGTGLGTLQEVFPGFETLYDGNIVNHSHDDYIEALAETGLIGGLIGIWFLAILFAGAWRNLVRANRPMDLALHIGGIVACSGLLVHSFVDFNLHIPSNALIFLLQAALATSFTSSRAAKLSPATPNRVSQYRALQV